MKPSAFAGGFDAEVLMFEQIYNEPGRVRLHLRGGFDGDASRAMWDGLCAVAAMEAGEVVIDLSNVTFLDGSGVGAIAFLFKRLAARGRRLTVAGVAGSRWRCCAIWAWPGRWAWRRRHVGRSCRCPGLPGRGD